MTYVLRQNEVDKEVVELWQHENDRAYLACTFHREFLPDDEVVKYQLQNHGEAQVEIKAVI